MTTVECPEAWSPYENSLLCYYDPCSGEEAITGRCGLAGECVECIVDEHCSEGICSLSGKCVAAECAGSADCDIGICVEGRC